MSRIMATQVLVLFSGGLDSILAVKILTLQKIEVTGITFCSYFFDNTQAKKAAKNLDIPLKVVDFSDEHLKMVKKPKYGYGANMNPCIDCHTLMIRRAKKVMEEKNFDFVATGEVLGERPMSQNPQALKLIEALSGLEGCLLRPLSARLLPETIAEKNGLVNREKLLAISGRSRKPQMELAKKWKIKSWPTPAGGCLLTDPGFSKRLKKLFEIFPACGGNDVLLLKYGRHFIKDKTKIIVGRNKEENEKIENLAQKGDIIIQMQNYPGPSTLVRIYLRKKIPQAVIKKACGLTQYYSTKTRDKKDVKFKIRFY